MGVAGRLQHLDGTPVLKQERLFLQRLHSRKLTRDASFRTAPNDNVARARNLLVSRVWQLCVNLSDWQKIALTEAYILFL